MNAIVRLEPATRADWAESICAAWRAGVESIIETGRRTAAAKARLKHGDFEEMVENDLPFGIRTAEMLMAIAKDKRLANTNHGSLFPPSWRTLYQLTRLDDDTFAARIADGTIHPEMQRKDIIHAPRRQEYDRQVLAGCEIDDLQKPIAAGEKFGAIYADPPWLYDNQATRAATGNHYAGMTVEEICALPIRELAADDAHLHLWITNAFLFEAPRIFESWGFEFRTTFIWCKPQMGIGNYWRNGHEIMLTAIRGDAKRFNDHSLRSWIECDRGDHSDKPDEVRSFIQRASPGPYLELFGRRPAQGWTVWGNQIEKTLFSGRAAA